MIDNPDGLAPGEEAHEIEFRFKHEGVAEMIYDGKVVGSMEFSPHDKMGIFLQGPTGQRFQIGWWEAPEE